MIFARYLILLLLMTAFAVAAVAQQARVIHLGYRVERLGAEREALAERSRKLRVNISALSHPARIADEIGRMDIGLLDPVALTHVSADGGPGEEADVQRARSR